MIGPADEICLRAMESLKSFRLREIERVTAMGEIEKKVKSSRSPGEYLGEKLRDWVEAARRKLDGGCRQHSLRMKERIMD